MDAVVYTVIDRQQLHTPPAHQSQPPRQKYAVSRDTNKQTWIDDPLISHPLSTSKKSLQRFTLKFMYQRGTTAIIAYILQQHLVFTRLNYSNIHTIYVCVCICVVEQSVLCCSQVWEGLAKCLGCSPSDYSKHRTTSVLYCSKV